MKIQLFIPCFIDQLYPQTGFNTIKLLEKAGCEVLYNPNQTCCGQPAFNSGYWDEAAALAHKFLNDFDPALPVVSPSGSCTGFVIHHYHKLLKDQPELMDKLDKQKQHIYELSDFLVNVLHFTNFEACFQHKVTYHDSCSALREYGIKNEPRQLLSQVKGLELIEMDECETCCGFGGTFAVKFEGISAAMAEQKVQNALNVKADYIISTDSSCLLQLQAYIEKNQLPIKTMHLVDVLTSGWANI